MAPATVLLLTSLGLTLGASQAVAASGTVYCTGTDATAGIKATLAGLMPTGGTLYLLAGSANPDGVCLISGSLSVPSGVTVIGSGAQYVLSGASMTNAGTPELNPSGTSTTLMAASATPDFPILNVSAGAVNVSIEGLTVSARGASTGCPAANSQGIQVSVGASGVLIENVEVTDAGSQGIRVQGASNVDILNNYIHESRFSGVYVVGDLQSMGASTRASSVEIIANYVEGYHPAAMSCATPPQPVDGIDIDRVTSSVSALYNHIAYGDLIVFDNAVYYSDTGGAVYGSFDHVVQWNSIDGSTSNGIDVAGVIMNPTIQHNTINNPTFNGIVINGDVQGAAGSLAQITNNKIVLAAAGKYDVVSFTDDIMYGVCSAYKSSMGCTILSDSYSNYLNFSGNNLSLSSANVGSAMPPPYYVSFSGTIGNSMLSENLCPSSTTCGVSNGYIVLGTIGPGNIINGISVPPMP